MKGLFWGLIAVVGVMLCPAWALAGQYQDQRLIEELQRQNRAVMEQQRRQYEEQQLQRQTEEINRMGEESRRNDPMRDVYRDTYRPRNPQPTITCPPGAFICY